jgi:phosphatidylserine decarboxylase
MKTPDIPVAREGYPFVLFAAFVTFILALLDCVTGSVFGLVITGFILWFFRDPERVTPDEEGAIICPADGKVIFIDKVYDKRFNTQEQLKISIFMNVFNVHVNRSPCTGVVRRVWLKPGRFYAADKEKAVLHNEYCAVELEPDSGGKIVTVQIAGLIARRIVCWTESGDRLSSGQRYGLIRFGSRVDLFLPDDCKVTVALGDKVRAGETLLGRLPGFPPVTHTEKTI